MSKLLIWFKETRPHFLLLTPVTVLVGISTLMHDKVGIDIVDLSLVLIGALLAHISVNVLNDYFDYKSGIDLKTRRTPFSGGSGILVSGLLDPLKVKMLGLLSIATGLVIAAYFYFKVGWLILLIALVGAGLIYFYTDYLTKVGLAEVAAGLGFALMALGSYYALSGSISETITYSSLVVFFTVANLLLLNEFPDVNADKAAGRRHLPILLGRKKASYVYVIFEALSYLTILRIAFSYGFLALMPLLSIPLAIRSSRGAIRYYDDINKLVPYLGENVRLVFSKLLLLSISLGLSSLLY